MIHQRPNATGPHPWWVKIADFGISKRTDPALTAPSDVIGTLDYMAPELLDHRSQNVDYRAADIWSVGCLAYYTLTKTRNYLSRRNSIYDEQRETDFLPGDLRIGKSGRDFLENTIKRDCNNRLRWEKASSHMWVEQSEPTLTLPVHRRTS